MPGTRDPLYIMIKPPAGVIDHVLGLPECDLRRSPDLLHLTAFVVDPGGSWPAVNVERVLRALSALRHAPFRVVFDRVVSGGGRAMLKPSEALRGVIAFHRAVTTALVRLVTPLPDHRFAPHITIAYQYKGGASRPIDPISWLVEDFALVESGQGEGHRELERWRLHD